MEQSGAMAAAGVEAEMKIRPITSSNNCSSGREATFQVPIQQQHPYQGIMNPNPTINFYSTQQMPHAAMGCPHGGDNSVARASFIPHELNGGECRGLSHLLFSFLLDIF